jgi:hypothetical protein
MLPSNKLIRECARTALTQVIRFNQIQESLNQESFRRVENLNQKVRYPTETAPLITLNTLFKLRKATLKMKNSQA